LELIGSPRVKTVTLYIILMEERIYDRQEMTSKGISKKVFHAMKMMKGKFRD